MRFHDSLKMKIDFVVRKIYKKTKEFPKEELYGITSQLRRACLSIMLNYIEGYARIGDKTCKNFLKISYGSLKETNYLIYFSYKEGLIAKKEYEEIIKLLDEIGAMLWKIIKGKEQDCKNNDD